MSQWRKVLCRILQESTWRSLLFDIFNFMKEVEQQKTSLYLYTIQKVNIPNL